MYLLKSVLKFSLTLALCMVATAAAAQEIAQPDGNLQPPGIPPQNSNIPPGFDSPIILEVSDPGDWQKKVSIDQEGLDISSAIKQAVEGTSVSFYQSWGNNSSVAGYTPSPYILSAKLKNVPIKQVLFLLATASDCSFTEDETGKKITVSYKQPGNPPFLKKKLMEKLFPETPLELSPAASPEDLSINLKADLASLTDIFGKLSSVSKGLNYVIHESLKDITVTAEFKNVSLQVALDRLADASGFQTRISGNTILAIPNPEQQSSPARDSGFGTSFGGMSGFGGGGATYGMAFGPQRAIPPDELKNEKIDLKYIGPESASFFANNYVPNAQILSGSGDSIIVQGTADDVKQAQDIISIIDTPEALVRNVITTVEAVITIREEDGKEHKKTVKSKIGNLENVSNSIQLKSKIEGAKYVDGIDFNIYFVASLNELKSEDGIQKKSGMISFDGMGTLNTTGEITLDQRFNFVAVVPNQSAEGAEQISKMLASGQVTDGEKSLQYEIYISAKTEPGTMKGKNLPKGYGSFGGYSFGGSGYGSYPGSSNPPQ